MHLDVHGTTQVNLVSHSGNKTREFIRVRYIEDKYFFLFYHLIYSNQTIWKVNELKLASTNMSQQENKSAGLIFLIINSENHAQSE